MKEWPIIFSAPMIKKILAGEKTMTRRLVGKNGPFREDRLAWNLSELISKDEAKQMVERHPRARPGVWSINRDGSIAYCPFKYGWCGPPAAVKVSSRLWVRETYFCHAPSRQGFLQFKADESELKRPAWQVDNEGNECEGLWPLKWKPAIHMYRWASRINLETVSVRFEHLQDITEEDARKEGFNSIESFKTLWDSLQGCCHQWKFNPWVWVIEFKKVE